MAMREKAGRWVALRVARKVGKSVPIIGTAVSVGLLVHSVRRKGTVAGILDSALDAIPVVGTLKNGIELLTDDWFPDLPVPAEAAAASTAAASTAAAPIAAAAAPGGTSSSLPGARTGQGAMADNAGDATSDIPSSR